MVVCSAVLPFLSATLARSDTDSPFGVLKTTRKRPAPVRFTRAFCQVLPWSPETSTVTLCSLAASFPSCDSTRIGNVVTACRFIALNPSTSGWYRTVHSGSTSPSGPLPAADLNVQTESTWVEMLPVTAGSVTRLVSSRKSARSAGTSSAVSAVQSDSASRSPLRYSLVEAVSGLKNHGT